MTDSNSRSHDFVRIPEPAGSIVARVDLFPSDGPTTPDHPLPGVSDELDRVGKTVFVGRAEPGGPLMAQDPEGMP